ncbi:DinB family protein [Anatilimnocola sp. NA78]|uniref:DinB family protein n=1 Tax=Anatilimnocola sp. NA78 TaxID=3415683 RepID=UPI003CE5C2DA
MLAAVAHELEAAVRDSATRLRQVDEATASQRPAPQRWTIKEVMGHLIDSATNNHQRFIRAQFVPELVFPKYEQNEWITAQAYNEVSWQKLLDLWQAYNEHLAHVIRQVRPAALPVSCVIGTYEPMTLEALIEDYVVHLRHHLQKIDERLAAQP